MQNGLTNLGKELYRGRRAFLVELCVILGAFLVGMGIVVVVMAIFHPDDYAELGSMLALVAAGSCVMVRGCFSNIYEFKLTLSMGRTRRGALGALILRLFFSALLAAGLLFLLRWLETALYARLYPTLPCALSMEAVITPRWMLVSVLGICALVFCISALLVRFGARAWAGFWLTWSLLCFVLPRLFHDDGSLLGRAGHWIAETVSALPPFVCWGAAVLTAAVALLMAARVYLRAEVKF